MPSLDAGPDIGAALKAIREFRQLTLEQVAETTCIRRAYLAAIEDRRLDALPSRPFTIGYIRAYANALGLDGEAAVRRFKADEPASDEGLRGPIGVDRSKDPRLMLVGVAGALIIAAIAIWNIAQRAMNDSAPPPPAAAVAVAPAPPAKEGPLALGAPLPAPVESTTPTPYETPGLEAATAAGGSADASIAARKAAEAQKAAATVEAAEPLSATFTPKGEVYGAAAEASTMILQARKGGSLIVRGPDGSVYFARQMAAGEAYRVPTLAGLAAEVSDPAAFQVFVAGQTKGLMPAAQVQLGKLAD